MFFGEGGRGKAPSYSDKDYKDSAAFIKLDKRRENGMKCRKKLSSQVGSMSLLHPCQDVAATSTSQLSFVARLIKHAPRLLRVY